MKFKLIQRFWKFKCFEILKGLHELKSFQSYQRFSENDFTVLIQIGIGPNLNECFLINDFIFEIGVKTHLRAYYGIDGYHDVHDRSRGNQEGRPWFFPFTFRWAFLDVVTWGTAIWCALSRTYGGAVSLLSHT